jgi:hypothetical protein
MPSKQHLARNPLIQMLLHLTGVGVAATSIYFALSQGTSAPVVIGLIVIVAMEAVLLYLKFRR